MHSLLKWVFIFADKKIHSQINAKEFKKFAKGVKFRQI